MVLSRPIVRRLSALVVVVFAGLTAAFGAAHGAPLRFLILDTFFGLVFVAAGLVAWERRPELPYGALLVASSALWFVGSYAPTEADWYSLFGFTFERYYDILLALIALSFPSGTLPARSRLVLLVMTGAYVLRSLGRLVVGCECMYNPVALVNDRILFDRVQLTTTAVIALMALSVAYLAISRLRATPVGARRVMAPVVVAGTVAALVAAFDAIDLITWIRTGVGLVRLADPWSEVASWTIIALVALVPLGYMIGVLRLRINRGPLASLAIELNRRPAHDTLQAAVRDALRDSSAQLFRWVPHRDVWLDTSDNPVPDPIGDGERSMMVLESDGEPVAAVVHDRAFEEDPDLLAAVGALLRLAIDNELLATEVGARLEEVRASRARLVDAAETERRRIERDLHDGAQQRLIAVALSLQEARAEATQTAQAQSLVVQLDDAAEELLAAIEELRELARGIHPAVLTEEGLKMAVTSLARRATLPVEVALSIDGRLPAPVESTAYFVVAEGLANVARHSRARSAGVQIRRANGNLEVLVSDDGQGGASAERGSGLSGLSDRVDAIAGTFEIVSPPAGGTTLKATIPCE